MASDPAWQIYEFERDGIRYVQINDATGKVRAAAGRIGGTFWVMPIGSDIGPRIGARQRDAVWQAARALSRQ